MLVHRHRQSFSSDIDFVFVVVYYYDIWPKVMLRSLRKYFDNEIIIVNHLDKEVPEEYYDDNCTILEHNELPKFKSFNCKPYGWLPFRPNTKTHGIGVDVAVAYLRDRGCRYFVLIEPDCLISGIEWMKNLLNAMYDGHIMAGPSRFDFGPIHPCPSIWDITKVPGSFDITARQLNVDMRLFDYKLMLKWVMATNIGLAAIWFWLYWWDCGLNNWYMAAQKGCAGHTKYAGDFRHFYRGHCRSPFQLPEKDFELVKPFLD